MKFASLKRLTLAIGVSALIGGTLTACFPLVMGALRVVRLSPPTAAHPALSSKTRASSCVPPAVFAAMWASACMST